MIGFSCLFGITCVKTSGLSLLMNNNKSSLLFGITCVKTSGLSLLMNNNKSSLLFTN